jgi:hypothetical protein
VTLAVSRYLACDGPQSRRESTVRLQKLPARRDHRGTGQRLHLREVKV